MSTVIVLGGCGAVGSVVVKTLADQDIFSRIIIGDINEHRARQIASAIRPDKISAIRVDAENPQSINAAIQGCDLVVNCIGPFYKTVKTILKTVIDAKINYVDVCDDVDVTLEILEMDAAARLAGVTALIGMGSSPGATNILAKFAADNLLDETDAVDIFHAHGGEPVEGEGVIGHRFHCMRIDIPMYLDGRLKYVKFFEEPHPEQVTIPKHIRLRQVTNRGTVLPNEYYNLTKDICQIGLTSREPVRVREQTVIPYDFAIAYIIQQREKILKETQFGQQRGCCSVVVKGKKDGKKLEYRFHMASKSQALGEGTGIPAAMGAILIQQGKISQKGVFPPEGCVNPVDFIDLITRIMKLDKNKKGTESFSGVIVQKVDEDGNIETIDI
ncbi:MAG: saccharopine dehydrogenase NADP-binding domain-containing protein [Desulfobacterales bacterium]|nr:saccharopine dehydrogenase NADP-binding domain-containing protein [Desulfobacterales bacterium]